MIIAVDTGGTKTLVAAFLDDGKIYKEVKFPTPKDEAEYLSQLIPVIHEVADEARMDSIVVAMPGIVKNGVAVWCNHTLWENFDVRTPLSHAFPDTPIYVENDANLGGLGEVRRLSPMPTSALYVTVSTGIGTGYIYEGHIDQGLRLSEGGRMPIEYDGAVREWEMFGAGSSIYATYGKYARDIHSDRIWKQIADRISRGFLVLIPVIQPDVVIIGGSVGTYIPRYKTHLENILREKLPEHIPLPIFQEAKDAEKAVIYGCFFYGHDSLAR